MILRLALLGPLLAITLLAPASAQTTEPDLEQDFVPPFDRTLGPTTGNLGSMATIHVPEGYAFLDGVNTGVLLDLSENVPSGKELGTVMPDGPEFGWALIFEFDDSGYVSDEEQDELDADAILEHKREQNKYGNQERARRGFSQLQIDGWQTPPRYNSKTNNLEWALAVSGAHGVSVNHNIRLLGREGVMEAELVCGQEDYESALADVASLLESFQYTQGHTYAEYREGDKIAKYGLTALVTGGAAALALKTGLLQKILKPLLFGLAAVGVFFKRIWSKISGKG